MGKGAKLFDSYAQFWTLITLVIHFLHCLLCLSNYLDWVRHQEETLGLRIVRLYLALTIIAIISYLLCSSVFYMWAWRYASSEDAAKRRRIWGIAINLLFADFPLFCVEVDIVWNVGFATGLQGLSFIFTCLSFSYSAIRVWLFAMVRVIKRATPHGHVGGVMVREGGIIPASPVRRDNPFGLGAFDRQPIDQSLPTQSFMNNTDEELGPTVISAALDDREDVLDEASHRAGGIIPLPRKTMDYPAPTPAEGIVPAGHSYSQSRAPSAFR
eukprot:TRINITY_DN9651_c0_g1_i1.p1 TRINITY_DN9651_c0_g1~~TRINITY_DN9651_c0_g1_i1.p1  ORF type:complete len:278 (+),score=108.36 TRINITY_DN9651_c0_g1_i1:27-836(+)